IAVEVDIERRLADESIQLMSAAHRCSEPRFSFLAVLHGKTSGAGIKRPWLIAVDEQISFHHEFLVIPKSAQIENLSVPGRAEIESGEPDTEHKIVGGGQLPVGLDVEPQLWEIDCARAVVLRGAAESLRGVKVLGPVQI